MLWFRFLSFLIFLLSQRFGCAFILTVKDFAASSAVQRALKTPNTVESVLSFFFCVDYRSPTDINDALRQGGCLKRMNILWFGGGNEYDKLCQPFREAVYAAGKNDFVNKVPDCIGDGTATITEVDKLMAQILLCDQLPRNIFRGASEAYAYEAQALEASRMISNSVLKPPSFLDGEIYPPYLSFTVTALMHSESLQDHELAIKLITLAQQTTPENLKGTWDFQMGAELEHKAVIERFGRYPHRNKVKGRTNTAEEQAWLADIEKLPGWARTQMK